MSGEETCGCGRLLTAAAWAVLPFVGHYCTPEDGEPAEHLELRNCECGSTRARPARPDHEGECHAR